MASTRFAFLCTFGIRQVKNHWEKPSRNQAKRKCEKTETTRPQQKMIEKGETNWDAIRRNYQYHPHWNAGNSATAGREAAAVINYWCRVAFTNTAHAFSKKTHGHPPRLCTARSSKSSQISVKLLHILLKFQQKSRFFSSFSRQVLHQFQ